MYCFKGQIFCHTQGSPVSTLWSCEERSSCRNGMQYNMLQENEFDLGPITLSGTHGTQLLLFQTQGLVVGCVFGDIWKDPAISVASKEQNYRSTEFLLAALIVTYILPRINQGAINDKIIELHVAKWYP